MIIHQKNKLKIKNKIFSYETLFSNFKCNEYIAFDYVLINISLYLILFFYSLLSYSLFQIYVYYNK